MNTNYYNYSKQNHDWSQNIKTPEMVKALAHGIAYQCIQNKALPILVTSENELENLDLITHIALHYLKINHDQKDSTFFEIYHQSLAFAERATGEIGQQAELICKKNFPFIQQFHAIPGEVIEHCLSYLPSPKDWTSFGLTNQRNQEIYEKALIPLINQGDNILNFANLCNFQNLERYLSKYGSNIHTLNLGYAEKWCLTIKQINDLIKHCPKLIKLSIPIFKTHLPQNNALPVNISNLENSLYHENLEMLCCYPNHFYNLVLPYFFDHCVANLKNLKELYFKKSLIEYLGYSHSMAHIQKIDVEDCTLLKRFKALIPNPQLTHLNLSGTSIEIEDLKVFTALKYLNLSHAGTDDISPLENLKLEYLNLNDSNVFDLNPIKNSKELKELILADELINNDLSILGNFHHLEVLEKLEITPNSDISVFSNLKKLKKLHSYLIDITDIYFLSPLVELESLDIRFIGSMNDDNDIKIYANLSIIAKFKNLKHLSINSDSDYIYFNKESIMMVIQNLENLECLYLNDYKDFNNEKYPTKKSIQDFLSCDLKNREEDTRKVAQKRLNSEIMEQEEPDAKRFCSGSGK